MRFGERITFKENIPEQLPDIKVPAFIIQPFIENAIIHGVGNYVDGGKVCLKVIEEGDLVIIKIEDNGVGMSSDTIERIISDDNLLESNTGDNGIGIINVKKRLNMFYCKKRIMTIDSNTGCGTVVTIRLPISNEVGEPQNV